VISTTPASPFTDGQEVVVHGSGFTPNATLGLAECQSGVEPNAHTCDSDPGLFEQFFADGNGEFTRTVTMRTHVQSDDATIDCTAGPGCVLFAANRNDYGEERASLAIAFGTGTTGGSGDVREIRALAFTGAGSRAVPLAVTGLSLLLVGGLIVLLTRRRRAGA
jgi:Neocarzinostatin family